MPARMWRGRVGSGQLRYVASWGPAVALASVSPSVQGLPGLQGDSAALPCCRTPTSGRLGGWGPLGETAVEDKWEMGGVSQRHSSLPTRPPRPRQARYVSAA